MESFINFVTDPRILIATFGPLSVIAVVFLETGFFFGFFLPGDSLLFTAGLLASQGHMSITWLTIGVFVAAVAGDSVGYAFGKKVGPALFSREDSKIFKREHLAHTQHFYEKYGARTIILARFIPIVRTFAPIVAGVGAMEYKKFIKYNLIGAFIWTVVVVGLGYGFGRAIPDPDKYLLPAIGVIILISAFPALRELWKRRRTLFQS
ncbi:MAG TPA: VTT domain-containing protein [Candidatus Paceibacterota bacterium]